MSTGKPSNTEDEYFMREELEKKHRLAEEKRAALSETESKELKDLHWMHCPKCGHDLETIRRSNVDVEKCFHCGVLVLDHGELEKLVSEEGSVVKSFFDAFRSTKS
jgi:ribosomal protein L37AE/L43A